MWVACLWLSHPESTSKCLRSSPKDARWCVVFVCFCSRHAQLQNQSSYIMDSFKVLQNNHGTNNGATSNELAVACHKLKSNTCVDPQVFHCGDANMGQPISLLKCLCTDCLSRYTQRKIKWKQTKVRRPIQAATVSKASCSPTACGHTGYHSLGPNGQRATPKRDLLKNLDAWMPEIQTTNWCAMFDHFFKVWLVGSPFFNHLQIVGLVLKWQGSQEDKSPVHSQMSRRTLQSYRRLQLESKMSRENDVRASLIPKRSNHKINLREIPWLML